MTTIDVLLPIAVNQPFTYTCDEDMPIGQLVTVPFRGKDVTGVVISKNTPASYNGKLKAATDTIPLPPFPPETLAFIEWISAYTMNPKGMVLKMVMGAQVTQIKKTRKPLGIMIPDLSLPGPDLSVDQQTASDAIQKAIQSHTFQPFLLDGVTGSGKTEVYLKAMAETFEQGKQVLVLLPEIALTAQWLDRFKRRFGTEPLQWHSALTPSVRRQTWQAVLEGNAPIIVGARSGLFLPFPNLGLIIVDEEHDASFKQEDQVIYHARDMAVVRARLSQAPIVLVSATPSLETVVNVQQGRYQCLELRSRHGGAVMPDVELIDMRKQSRGWISAPLQSAIADVLDAGEQGMLFLNRRGYAPLTLCHTCGFRFKCPNCTSWLVEHRRTHQLHCHYCDYKQLAPKQCPECQQEKTFIPCGPGVERIHESVQKLFPQARCALLTSDLIESPEHMHELIHQITNHEVDLLIGTQILAKGHHFPMMTFVGVVDADLGLVGGDLRACERTYQLLHQVSGRAGREKRRGRVMLQTFSPEHPVMQALKNQDRAAFMELEQTEREKLHLPPFGKLAAVIISGVKPEQVEQTAVNLRRAIPQIPEITVLGPVPAPLSQLRGKHRWRALLKCPKSMNIQAVLNEWIQRVPIKGNVSITVDIDPQSFT